MKTLTLLLVYLDIWVFQAFGLLISATTPMPNIMTATILVATFNFSWTGFLAPIFSIPVWLRWLRFFDLLVYLYEVLFKSQNAEYACNPDIKNSQFCVGNQTVISLQQTNEFFGFGDINDGISFTVLVLSGFFLRLVAYWFYRYRLREVKVMTSIEMSEAKKVVVEVVNKQEGDSNTTSEGNKQLDV